MSYTSILIETIESVGLIRLNRPKALNALNSTIMSEVIAALRAFDDNEQIKAIVITGNDKAFAAGADITEMVDASSVDMFLRNPIANWDNVSSFNKPLIAAVSGWCLGGGAELAMACDMIVASETAKFGQPEINIGVIPGAGGTQRLTRAVGKAIAMEMVINNRTLSAQEALQHGLVNNVVPVEAYLEDALSLAKEIAARAPLAVRVGREMVNHAFESFLTHGIISERRSFYSLFASEDQQEGMRAFTEKRAATWKGQ